MNEINAIERTKLGESKLIEKMLLMRPIIEHLIFLHWAWACCEEGDILGILAPGKIKVIQRRNHQRHIDSSNIIGDPCKRVLRSRKF
jgi:hypothetical protein